MARKKRRRDEDEGSAEDGFDRGLSVMNLRHETVDAISSILFIAVAVFMLFASPHIPGGAGPLGEKIFAGLHYLFGIGYYLVPLLLVALALSFLRNLKHNFAMTKIIGASIFFLSGLSMVHLLMPDRGGIVGSFIASPIIRLVDVQATFLFLFAFLVISFLVMFDTPLTFGFIKRMFQKKEIDDNADETAEPVIIGDEVPEKQGKRMFSETNNEEESAPQPQARRDISKTEKEDKDSGESVFSIFSRRKDSIEFTPPPLSLLEGDRGKPNVGDVKANANLIKRTLQNFGIPVEMDEITIGPTVTRYALKPAEGVKLSKIENLQSNLALALAAQSIRIEAPIPGKSLVGIEVPNVAKTTVGLASMLGSSEFQNSDKPLLTSIGKTVAGKPYYANVAKMPHLLIAGTTGSGKSVTVHAILTSLLYRNSPDMLKFIMVDAKRVELTLYNKIPHLLTPVITDAKKTIMALRWAAKEMDRRYDILEKESVRDIHSYHKNVVAKKDDVDMMPYIVIVIDELADLMQAYPRELEGAIVRLAQMSRAVGIHLILSTQRPSVNVITGLIKANIPTRIALKVGSQIDSRTIIDRAGAEKLVGQGDMLYVSQDNPDPIRVQSPFISEDEVKEVVKYFVDKYKDEVPPHELSLDQQASGEQKNPLFEAMSDEGQGDPSNEDDLYDEAKRLVIEAKRASTSYIQRKLRVGYARAARLMDMLEERGVIAPGDGTSKPREVLDNGAAHDETGA